MQHENVTLDTPLVLAIAECGLSDRLHQALHRPEEIDVAPGEQEAPACGAPMAIHERCSLREGDSHHPLAVLHAKELLLRPVVNLIAYARRRWPPCLFALEALVANEPDYGPGVRMLVRVERAKEEIAAPAPSAA